MQSQVKTWLLVRPRVQIYMNTLWKAKHTYVLCHIAIFFLRNDFSLTQSKASEHIHDP